MIVVNQTETEKTIKMNHLKLFNMLLIFLTLFVMVKGQMRTVSGIITGQDGEPLPGVSIAIKGTNKGTITNIDGYYSIDAPVGSTLCYSYVGFINEEVKVTENFGKPSDNQTSQEQPDTEKKENKKQKNQKTEKLKETGVSNGIGNFLEVSQTESNRVLKRFSNGRLNNKQWYISGEIKSDISFDAIRNLPELQNNYAQGRSEAGEVIWQGPETGEIFSWGPPIINLEYDGQNYLHDYRGGLVLIGTGNGKAAKAYNPLKFFRQGNRYCQNIKLSAGSNNNYISLKYTYSNYHGVIPKSSQNQNGFSLNFENSFRDKIKTSLDLSLLNVESTLMNDFSQTRIYSMLLRTPRTFDITNGINPKKAIDNHQSYLTTTGSQRSFAINYSDNPYWLVNNILDNEEKHQLNTSFKSKIQLFNDLSFHLNLGYNTNQLNNQYGYKLGTAFFPGPISIARDETLTSLYTRTELLFTPNLSYGHELSGRLTAGYHQQKLKLVSEQITESPYVDSIGLNHSINQNIWEYSLQTTYNLKEILLTNFTLNLFNSSTSDQIYLTPVLGIGLRLPHYWSSYFIEYLKVTASLSSSVYEPALQYRRGLMNSTLYTSNGFDEYFEYFNVINNGSAKLEKHRKFEIGTQVGLFYSRLQASFYYYKKKQNDYAFPVFSGNIFTVKNVADLITNGVEFDITYRMTNYRFSWISGFNFHKSHTVVRKLHQGEIITGGFADVSSVLIEGQPYGVIVGSDYLHDELNNLVIGDDGYPLVDNQKKILGNPAPDYIIGFHNQLDYKGFQLVFVIDARIGGEIWNGTANHLNYLGLSEHTSELRSTRDYIFNGVRSDGSINNTRVDFYNPDLPVYQNRWVRYGPSGVASDAIVDATSVRLSSLEFSYTFNRNSLSFGSSLKLSVYGNNLLHIAGYQGPDPQNMLLGYSNNLGFDYFNMPPLSTYGFAVNFKF